MKLNKLLKKAKGSKDVEILLFAAIANLAILALLGSFDIVSALLYVALAGVVALVFQTKKKKSAALYALMAVGVSLIYNIGGSKLELFIVAPPMVAIAAVQQGVIGFLVAKFKGVKKNV